MLALFYQWPHAITATSTHDPKRSEDVRSRLNVLSELPNEWETAVNTWRSLNGSYKKVVRDEQGRSHFDRVKIFYRDNEVTDYDASLYYDREADELTDMFGRSQRLGE